MDQPLDQIVLTLSATEVESLANVARGVLSVDSEAIIDLVEKAIGVHDLHTAVDEMDFGLLDGGELDVDRLSLTGVWWWPLDVDVAMAGGFSLQGLSLRVTIEGVGESPLAEDPDVLLRATKVIASQYREAVYLQPGLFRLPSDAGVVDVRVVVVRDRRIRCVPDMLDDADFGAFIGGTLGVVVVKNLGTRSSGIDTHAWGPDVHKALKGRTARA